MKKIVLERYGAPDEVARCVDVPDVGAPGAGEVVFDVLAFPINPADVWFCRGQYRLKPPLPATPGAECVGRVAAVGAGVSSVAPGDLVINLLRENWAQRRRVREADVVRLPAGIDLEQAAMLRINPPTALLMLTDLVALEPGQWVAQNVANSAVGRWVIVLARSLGLKTLNVVRREALFGELRSLGAHACLVDGPDLGERAARAVGGEPIRLALDAVAGAATARLADCVADGGTVCSYGSMTGEDPVMPRSALIYRGLRLEGFMLGRFLERRTRAQLEQIYSRLAGHLLRGDLTAPVEQVYPIERIGEALRHAQRGERSGKILVAPNGPIA
jgi:NADPH:quinone reductase-like Zn-dependent oxidoreductase